MGGLEVEVVQPVMICAIFNATTSGLPTIRRTASFSAAPSCSFY
jgi:hypothetical protein